MRPFGVAADTYVVMLYGKSLDFARDHDTARSGMEPVMSRSAWSMQWGMQHGMLRRNR
jgi:hypothetical protein